MSSRRMKRKESEEEGKREVTNLDEPKVTKVGFEEVIEDVSD